MFPKGTCVGVLYPLVHDVASMSDLLLDLHPYIFKVQGVLGNWYFLGSSWEFLGVGISLEKTWEVDII